MLPNGRVKVVSPAPRGGLVHKSELADKFVKDPTNVVKLHQKVDVTVLNVDIPRKRISLSMKRRGSHLNY